MTDPVPSKESDTPLTDAAVWYAEHDSMPTIPVVDADFARALEHRVNKLEAQIITYLVKNHGFISGNQVMGWQHPHSAPEPGVSVDEAFELGWRTAADWAKRGDLISDIGSPAYLQDRRAAFAEGTAQPPRDGQ